MRRPVSGVATMLASVLALGIMAAHPAPVAGTATVATPWPVWSDGVPACQEEDGSTPGQLFPCRWEGADQGNRHGLTFTLTGPA